MSLSGALNSSVSALKAQSTAIATVSDNLANSSTYGYKTTVASFESLVTGASTTSYSSGGVISNTRSNISAQGQLTRTTNDTDVAIQGNGFFVVSSENDPSRLYYTRDGEFSLDESGYLVNGVNRLLGWQTDAAGNILGSATIGNLSQIYTNVKPSCAGATTTASLSANLPSNHATGTVGTMDVEVYDSQGNAHTMSIAWTKTGANAWTAAVSSTGATFTPASFAITFNTDGSIATASASQSLSVNWANGTTNPQPITLNLSGVTQQSVDSQEIELRSISQDGMAYGALTGISIADGMVDATYSNGETIKLYKIAVATFTNPDGLEASSAGLYSESGTSGTGTLHVSGSGGAGTVYGSTLEASKTDTSEEFSTMITAQQAYSASAQVISTVSNMYQTLMQALR